MAARLVLGDTGRDRAGTLAAAPRLCARLAGVDVPKHEDTETSFEELKARIDKTLAFIATIRSMPSTRACGNSSMSSERTASTVPLSRFRVYGDRLGAGPRQGDGVHLGSDPQLDHPFGADIAAQPELAVVRNVGTVGQVHRHAASVAHRVRPGEHRVPGVPRADPAGGRWVEGR
mgnify:CR=1 FL=1